MKSILQAYLRRLTNLSSSSRSLFLPRLSKEQFVDLHDFDFVQNQPSFHVLEALLARKNQVVLCDRQNSRDESSNQLAQRLTKLERIDRLIFEERGAKDLYVGWPFVKGKFSDGSLVRCPLMFFPIALEAGRSAWYLKSRKDVNITLNKSFLLAYAYFNGLEVNEHLLERVFDDFDKESRGFRTQLYALLEEEDLAIHFNPENFEDRLKPFVNYRKAELETLEKKGELKLFPHAVAGIFPQAGSYLVPDYLTLLDDASLTSFEQFFSHRNLDEEPSQDTSYYRFLKKVREDQTFTPFVLDAYQENALKAIKKGNSVVVQGPPGTGKSQLICNLVADYIARGKNVLVVSQKRAALDVVFERLKDQIVNDFIGLLHDFKNDRKSIYEQLKSQIDRIEEYQETNYSLDTVQTERNFLKASRRIDQLEEALSEFKQALFDESECGVSVKELYLTSSPHASHVPLKMEYRKFRFDAADHLTKKLKAYASYGEKFLDESYPWYMRKTFARYQVSDLNTLLRHLGEITPCIPQWEKETMQVLGKKVAFEDAVSIIRKQNEMEHLLHVLKDPNVYHALAHLVSHHDHVVKKDELIRIEKIVMQQYEGQGPELSLPAHELGRFQGALKRSVNASKNFFKWWHWKAFSKDKLLVHRALINNKLKRSKPDLKILEQKIDLRLNLEHHLSQLKNKPALSSLPDRYGKVEIKNWFFFQKQALEMQTLLDTIRPMNEYLSPARMEHKTYLAQLRHLLQILQPMGEQLKAWEQYFSIPQLNRIFSGHTRVEDLSDTLKRDFEALCEFDSIQQQLSEDEKRIIAKLQDEAPQVHADRWLRLFDNSLRLAWIEHIELKYPILRAVSSQKFDTLQQELQESVEEKIRLSAEILLIKTRERVYNNLEYNRLNNRMTYRELHHQVGKKRRIWPVRKLIAHHAREVFDLIPCWLVSPESASAIFPMEKVFDLVIFDEASQCFAEKGLPAIYRGKQVVMAGDEKQLKPNNLYQVRWYEDHEDEPAAFDIDSLLHLGTQHLMQIHLRGHYRSKNIDLIRFSNEHFYANRLSMLPDLRDLNQSHTAIDYIKVAGTWQQNTNPTEAQRVVLLIQTLLKQRPEVTIGVVTFNVRQQILILEHLEAFAAEHHLTLPQSLIVKNIENMQGDEKDIIIFSTAYAPDEAGKINMHFGSLNQHGGENRLNVAITRAREKIYIVTSLLPEQLNTEASKHPGPQLLKEYLAYAYAVSHRTLAPPPQAQPTHTPSWYLKNKIAEMDFPAPAPHLSPHLPLIDLAISLADQYLGALMTDDQAYYQDISVKASHAYKPFVLKEKHWAFRRIFSRQYWHDPQQVQERILQLISTHSHRHPPRPLDEK